MKSRQVTEEVQVLMYLSPDGEKQVEVLYRGESVWLNQEQIARLFDIDPGTVATLIHQLYTEDGYDPAETTTNMRRTSAGGKLAQYYNLEIILAVGQLARSKRAADFRKWANRKLAEYMRKGFLLDDERLARGGSQYFEELQQRVRKIRTSEANFYHKVRHLFATSYDYDKNSQIAHDFYATVQNKFHYAVHGRTAAEMVLDRVDPEKLNMGAIIGEGKLLTVRDAVVAKNYLSELELSDMEQLANAFLAYADMRVSRRDIMTMKDWVEKLDAFIKLAEYPVLTHKGQVSHDSMVEQVRQKYEDYKRLVMEAEMLSDLEWEQKLLDAAEHMLLPPEDELDEDRFSNNYYQRRLAEMSSHGDEAALREYDLPDDMRGHDTDDEDRDDTFGIEV